MTPSTVAHQAPLSMEFSRQGYWSKLLFPTPGDLLDTGLQPVSLESPTLAGRLFTTVSLFPFLDIRYCTLWLDEAQAGIKVARRTINNLRYADDTTFMAEGEEELKSLLMKVKDESEKVGLKLSIQNTKIMAFDPITSWQIDGQTVETVADFIWEGSKITADGDYSHEIKRHLLLGRKAMINLDSVLKGRDITLSTKVHLIKAMVFLVMMYACESWSTEELMLLNCGVAEDS